MAGNRASHARGVDRDPAALREEKGQERVSLSRRTCRGTCPAFRASLQVARFHVTWKVLLLVNEETVALSFPAT